MKDFLKWASQYNKAFMPLAVAGVLALLAGFGITGDMTVKEALTTVLSLLFAAVGVWFVPNAKKK